ncbi:hypothetical protein PtrSN002B_004986 [Pyrenophora tritici-repentis]|uniref:Tymo-45kd-70kd multi-domain protein n=2 Tax=Pyrenophora tritici-repentis TaxID=45151 RepID=A0A2W1D1B8_9PLEO|nr:uncharacterized protein PTRG_07890 [Pyrenophora tritici-repentis Pt-1C-BFP]KAA8616772.1 hypothetical protein PtrV1_10073 [Pyrenophora tritici-repentis]EDU50809.1 conserved hypothetical protein [Pyrenophora tritici-repentis Pt-1C-BFP]KAF7446061.1 hypothetical protein A1F99_093520 [Pyrenophora tritici-repentis]KAF7567168.1 Tymo-45kd-70kd multi-domain protein [Pyrenophora tritici-repentis]KAG9381769.1 hypothetical protein A1F94_007423 [Pyrenophora tritici-repentis]
MSENDNPVSANGGVPQFTERELQMLGWAMQSLKSGPPDIDFDKLAAYASMTNPGSARNAWAKIRVKLTPAPDGTAPVTPKKTPRKKAAAAKKADGEEGPAATTPKKTPTPRKRAPKKQDVDGESSPKKKTTRGKKVSDDEAKSEENEDFQMETDPEGAPEETIEKV